jgi:hypothetical protein
LVGLHGHTTVNIMFMQHWFKVGRQKIALYSLHRLVNPAIPNRVELPEMLVRINSN